MNADKRGFDWRLVVWTLAGTPVMHPLMARLYEGLANMTINQDTLHALKAEREINELRERVERLEAKLLAEEANRLNREAAARPKF